MPATAVVCGAVPGPPTSSTSSDGPQGFFGLRRSLREMVSKKKRRFRDDAFDLDLTYVTERIIAMGAPCEGVEAAYRNPASEVQSFLETRHLNHYKVINLCSERETVWFPLAERCPFDDHTPCPLDMLVEVCSSIDAYLARDPMNVVAVHCKAGKGRTGLVVSCYLQHAGLCGTVAEALALFGERRTTNGKGVTIPSQIRYASYYGRLRRDPKSLSLAVCSLRGVSMVTIPAMRRCHHSVVDVSFKVYMWIERQRQMVCVFDLGKARDGAKQCQLDAPHLHLDCSHSAVALRGDIHLAICCRVAGGGRHDEEVCSVWFNTKFADEKDGVLRFTRDQIDGASKEKVKKKKGKRLRFQENFEISVFIDRLAESEALSPRDCAEAASPMSVDREFSGWWERPAARDDEFLDSECDSSDAD